MSEQRPLRIVQLYPDLLGVTGDRGNVEVLVARAAAMGVAAERVTVGMGEDPPEHADLVVIGNGPLSALRTVAPDLSARAPWLRAHLASGVPVFAVGGGAELLGSEIRAQDGGVLAGLGLIPAATERVKDRRVGYIVAKVGEEELIGFEDHASEWVPERDASSTLVAGAVIHGAGSAARGADRGELLRTADGIVATHVQGPVLPLNPWLADELLTAAARQAGTSYEPGGALDAFDAHARAARATMRALASDKSYTVIQL